VNTGVEVKYQDLHGHIIKQIFHTVSLKIVIYSPEVSDISGVNILLNNTINIQQDH